MKNPRALLGVLAVLLVGVLFWLLAWNPKQDEILALDEDIAAAQAEQAELQARIQRLETVRAEAPEVASLIAASEAIVPADPALPSALRQLQVAATDANLKLRSVSPGRPQPIEDPEVALEPGTQLVAFDVAVIVEGSYFQIVDFLRRVEDPAITPRGLRWTQLSAAQKEEGSYPLLMVDLVGRLYGVVPAGGTPEDPTLEQQDGQTDDGQTDDGQTEDGEPDGTDSDTDGDDADQISAQEENAA
jgi:Tfp pilus assembly protein PilO